MSLLGALWVALCVVLLTLWKIVTGIVLPALLLFAAYQAGCWYWAARAER